MLWLALVPGGRNTRSKNTSRMSHKHNMAENLKGHCFLNFNSKNLHIPSFLPLKCIKGKLSIRVSITESLTVFLECSIA